MSNSEQDDDWIDDEDLLIEAARFAVKQGVARNAFMSRAKKCWYRAAIEMGVNPQMHGTEASRSG